MIEATIGLDTIAYLLRIEDCFGITIPDDEADKLETVGDLFSYVRSHVAPNPSRTCLTAKAFYLLRRTLMENFGCRREDITLSMPVHQLFPPSSRRERVRELARYLHVSIPEGPVDKAVGLPLLPIVTGTILAGLALLCLHGYPLVASCMGGAAIGTFLILFALVVVINIAMQCPRYETVGALVSVVLERNFKAFTAEGASDQQVWESIVAILCCQAGLKRCDVTPNLRFMDIPGDM